MPGGQGCALNPCWNDFGRHPVGRLSDERVAMR